MYHIKPSPEFQQHIATHHKHGNKKLLKKLDKLLLEIQQHPRTGTGKVERLKHYREREIYSRRLDKEHRLVYEIIDDTVVVILLAAFGHY